MSTERTWVGPSAPERLNILRNTESIAIVGMSNKPRGPATSWPRICCLRPRTACTS